MESLVFGSGERMNNTVSGEVYLRLLYAIDDCKSHGRIGILHRLLEIQDSIDAVSY